MPPRDTDTSRFPDPVYRDTVLAPLFDGARSHHAAGFDRINVDMMFGLPRQSVAEGVDDLAAGLALETTHFSWYQLTLEPNTRFYQHPPPLPEDDDLIELGDAGINITPKGRLLLRNIAMTFDRYIDLEENDNRFSKAI